MFSYLWHYYLFVVWLSYAYGVVRIISVMLQHIFSGVILEVGGVWSLLAMLMAIYFSVGMVIGGVLHIAGIFGGVGIPAGYNRRGYLFGVGRVLVFLWLLVMSIYLHRRVLSWYRRLALLVTGGAS